MSRKMWKRNRRSMLIFGVLLTMLVAATAQADPEPGVPQPEGPTAEKLETSVQLDFSPRLATNKVDPSLIRADGRQVVIVRLSQDSAGQTVGSNNGGKSSAVRADQVMASDSAAQDSVAAANAQQSSVMQSILAVDPNARIIARTQIVLNAIFVELDAAAIPELASSADIISINQVKNYSLDLSETVPYIGGTAVQNMGYDGSGIRVAVLDSGVDYTHANLGGGGTLADYEAAWGTTFSDPANTTRDGLFPTTKVVEGFDFVGEDWPNSPEAFDDDPIDFEGHGTHVADIIAGANGVAPGADIVAVKVCSAVSSSCSGLALILGMEYAVSQGVDIINMSLGSDYGSPFDDDLTAAVEAASDLGVLTVSSAGNGGNNQYKVGTPSTAPSALSVAQTAVPSAGLDFMQIDGGNSYPAIFQNWSVPLSVAITGPAQYGDLDGTNLNGCAAFSGDLTGLVVLVDRGACSFSVKISNVAAANGSVGIIGLVAPGEAFTGGFGGGTPDIPGFMVDQAAANDFKAAFAAGGTVTFDPANALSLAGTMTSSSSRGPSNDTNQIKPEIGAPGASISAEAGTGTGETPFGGTSGASPMVAGAAALLMDAYDINSNSWIRPDQIKAMLMNNGETEIYTTSPAISTQLAPITRIGGGEVRVDRALASNIVAYSDAFDGSGALSFGQVDVNKKRVYTQRFIIDNLSAQKRKIALSAVFRDAAKEASGAVTIKMPNQVTVPGYQARIVTVRITVDPELLPDWTMGIGAQGSGAATLDINEFDGYIMMDDTKTSDDDADQAHMAWHILPRKSGNTKATKTNMETKEDFFGFPAATTPVKNRGKSETDARVFTYLAGSPDLPPTVMGTQSPIADIKHAGYRAFLDDGSSCDAGWGMEFLAAGWERQTHEWPDYYQFVLDVDNNGAFDHVVYHYDLFNFTGTLDGRNLTYVDTLDEATGSAINTTAFFFTDSPTNFNNYIMTICGEQLGFADTSAAGAPMPAVVTGVDGYYTGAVTDVLGGLVVSPFGNRYDARFVADDGSISRDATIAGDSTAQLTVFDFGAGSPGNDTGVILVYHNGALEGRENDVITIWSR
ncbi:MAG: S8 family serine peptidase [Anaerolineae bacterium]